MINFWIKELLKVLWNQCQMEEKFLNFLNFQNVYKKYKMF